MEDFETATSQTLGATSNSELAGSAVFAGENFGRINEGLFSLNNWIMSTNSTLTKSGARGWYVAENTEVFPNGNPSPNGDTNNEFAFLLDGASEENVNKLVYTVPLSLVAGQRLKLELDTWRTAGQPGNTLFARLTMNPGLGTESFVDLLGAAGTFISGVSHIGVGGNIAAETQTITQTGDYIFSIWSLQPNGDINHMYIDNLNLIPEPSIPILYAVGMVPLLLRRRRS